MFKKICGGMRLVSIFAIIITSVLIFSVMFFVFELRFKEELMSEAETYARIYNEFHPNYDNFSELFEEKTVVVVSSDNKMVLFSDSNELFESQSDVLKLASINDARLNGRGESQKYIKGFLRRMNCASIKLDDGNILTVAGVDVDAFEIIFELLTVVIIMGVLIYIFSAMISKRLTENIIETIEKQLPDNNGDIEHTYDELKPFITKISAQNAEIKRQMERVKRQKLRLQAVSESMSEGLVVLDRDGFILSVNDSAMRYFGISGNEKYTKTELMSLTGGNTDFADNIIKALHKERGSFIYSRDDKSFEVFYSPVIDEDKILGVVILMFDITDRLKNEQIRTEFTANVSHELKTPLTTIHGYSQLLSGGFAKSEDVVSFASKIEKESKRLIALVEDIIELSNLDEGAMGEKTTFSVYPMVCEIVEGLVVNASKRDISLNVEGDDFYYYGDSIRIHELIYNIIDNAVKYNKDGGSVDIEIENGVIVVKDTGIGIPDEYKERIFERFFRVDKSHSKKVNGTGLGLSIVKHIAINNGISIDVDSVVGEGSTFRIIFNI